MNKLLLGDSKKLLAELATDSVDSIVTDPPYGLEFMAKDWDKTLPPKEIWAECLRVLKPGAFAFIMCASRSNLMARLIMDLEEVGFITEFTPIFWSYASGFPKAHKIEEGKYAGFQPKPAVEIVVVVMKPLTEKSYTDQALKNNHGVTWLDNARIPTDEMIENHSRSAEAAVSKGKYGDSKAQETHQTEGQKRGRFPANLIVSDDILNDGEIRKSGKLEKHHKYSANSYKGTDTFKMRDRSGEVETYGDEGSYSRFFDLDAWFHESIVKKVVALPIETQRTFPFLITPKSSVSEKNEGLENMENAIPTVLKYHRPTTLTNPENWKYLPSEVPYGGTNRSGTQQNAHPTVKPITLMSWLIMLGSDKGEVILDPFVGSGTTAIACVLTDREYIGMEIDKEYFEIAMRRLTHFKQKMKPNIDVLDGL